MEFPIGLFFDIFGKYLLENALKQIPNLGSSPSKLANAIITHKDFKEINKERLLRDEQYFRSIIGEIQTIEVDVRHAIESVLHDHENIQRIQTYILNDRFVREQMQLTEATNRLNFLILGHKQAGKTIFLTRLMYSLTKHPGIGILMDEKDIWDKSDRSERFERYRKYLQEITRLNEDLNASKLPPATTKKAPAYIDMDFYELNWHTTLKFFDYAGVNLEKVTDFNELLKGEAIDGVIVVLDTYRLLAPTFRETLYKNGTLNRDEHGKKYNHLMNRILIEEAELDQGLDLLFRFAVSDKKKSMPVAFVITKFDGFENYALNENSVKEMLHEPVGNLALRVFKRKRDPIAICLTTAFGDSTFKYEENGELKIDDVHTALPALTPKGAFPFEKYRNIRLPFFFLIESHIQRKIKEAKELFLQCHRELGFIKRFQYGDQIQNIITVLDKESKNWKVDTLTDNNFLMIPQGHTDPENLLNSFFLMK